MECFKTQSSLLPERFDPHFHRPVFHALYNQLQKNSHKTLAEVIEFSSETWDQKSIFKDEFPYIEISEIDITTGQVKNISFLKKSEAPSRAKMIVKTEDIIVSTTRPNRGAISFVNNIKNDLIASTGFAILRQLKSQKINKKYLFYFLRTNLALEQMNQRSSGGNYPAITIEELKKIIVPTPPLSKQNQIVEIMESAYQQKQTKEQAADKSLNLIDDTVFKELKITMPLLKEKKTFTVQASNLQKSRIDAYYHQPKFDSIVKEIHKTKYRISKLDDLIADLSGGATPRVGSNAYTDSNGIPFLRVQNITKEGIKLNDVKYISKGTHNGLLQRSQLKENDLVFTITGRIGSVAVVPKNFQGNINQHSVRFHLKEKIDAIELNPYFVAIYLNTQFNNLLCLREATGGTRPALDYKALRTIEIPIPPITIQNQIVSKISTIFKNIEQLRLDSKTILTKAKEKIASMVLC